MSQNASIMVVDDNPTNLKLLEEMLRKKGYAVRSFPRGRLALAAAAQQQPDLILLDINMPELSGYEVCERLKGDDKLSAIPVIFISALHEIEDKIKGFRTGGVDYISKPFQFEEVHARVDTHIKLAALRRALSLQNEQLEQAVAERTRELAEANARLKMVDSSKNDFLNLISHELRTPLNGLLGVGELALDQLPATPEDDELRDLFDRSRRRILSMLDNALLLAELDVSGDNFTLAPVLLSAVLTRAIKKTADLARSRRVILQPPPPGRPFVLGQEELLVTALQALLETAVKLSVEGETVRIAHDYAADAMRVTIESQGRTIPVAMISKFFDLFSMSDAITPGGDLGLGPPVAYRIISLFGGSVSIVNRNPAGVCLTVSMRSPDPGTCRTEPSPAFEGCEVS
jgi:two-component system sensor histidine kinase/response regulator